jgi:aminoglycoside phosphotransferase
VTRAEARGDPRSESSANRGALAPFRIDPGARVLWVGRWGRDARDALASGGVDVVAHRDAEPVDGTFDVVIDVRLVDGGPGDGGIQPDALRAAATHLRDDGTLVLALRDDRGANEGSTGVAGTGVALDRAGVSDLLAELGFAEPRWLLVHPDLAAPEVVLDAALLATADGEDLARCFVRRPATARDATGSVLVGASGRGHEDSVMSRSAALWVLPPAHRLDAWSRVRELVDIDGRWLLHSQGPVEPVVSGPFVLDPVTVAVPVGRSGEDLLTQALVSDGPYAGAGPEILGAWWQAAERAIRSSEPGRQQLDLRPRNFIVTANGAWTFVPDDLALRFPMPPESLAYGAIVRTLVDAVLPVGWIPGLDPSLSVSEAARRVLEAVGVRCDEEHVYLWSELLVDLEVRTSAPGVDRGAVRRAAAAQAGAPIGNAIARLPPDRLQEAALEAARLSTEVRVLRADLAAHESAPQRHGGQRHAAPSTLVPTFSSEGEYLEAAMRLHPWRPALAEICRREDIEPQSDFEVATCCKHPVFLVPPSHFVKLYLEWANGHLVHAWETRGLALVARAPDLPAPRAVGSGEPVEGTHYVVMSRVPGSPLTEIRDSLQEAALVDIAAWAGRYLRRLHSIELATDERPAAYEGLRATVAWHRESTVADLERRAVLPPHLLGQVDGWLPSIDELVGAGDDLAIVHGDFKLKHVFVTVSDGRAVPSGVIDFNASRILHRMWDHCYAWAALRDEPVPVAEAFLREVGFPGYGEPGFARKALAWALVQGWDRAFRMPDLAEVRSLDELAERAFTVGRGHGGGDG